MKRKYEEFQKTDLRLPSNPDQTYKEDWTNWDDFFGKEEFYTYKEAKKVVQLNGIQTIRKYEEFQKTDLRLPSNLYLTYKEDWTNWNDFLEREPKLDFESAKKLVKLNKIQTIRKYNEFQKTDPKIPSVPNRYYKEDWTNWNDFLGREKN